MRTGILIVLYATYNAGAQIALRYFDGKTQFGIVDIVSLAALVIAFLQDIKELRRE